MHIEYREISKEELIIQLEEKTLEENSEPFVDTNQIQNTKNFNVVKPAIHGELIKIDLRDMVITLEKVK